MTDATERHGHLKHGRARASLHGVFWSLVNTGFGTVLTAVVFYIASRFLTPYDFGVVALAVSVVSIASAVAPAAFGQALIQRPDIGREHLDSVFWMCMTAAVVLYLPLLALAPAIADWLDEPVLAVLLPFVGTRVFFEMLAAVPNAVIVRRMRFKLIALRTVIANGVSATVCILMLLLGYGFWALALSQVTMVAVAAVVVLVSAGWRPGLAVRVSAIRDLAPYGVFAAGSHMLSVLRLDQLMIGALGGAAFAGLYNFASRLFQMLSGLISGALAQVTHALFSSLQSEREKGRQAFLLAVYASALVAFPLFAGLILVADPAVPLIFGEQWRPGIRAVQAFAVIGLLASIGFVQASLITGHGKTNWLFYYQVARQVVSITVVVLLMPVGFEATMIGLAATAVLIWPVSVAMTMRLIGIGALDYARVFTVPAISVLVMAAVVESVPMLAPRQEPGAQLATQILAGAAVYTALAGALSVNRLRPILSILASRKKAQTA